jgi:hypothetical protein
MKILRSQLRKIIKEEIEKAVEEQYSAGINDPAMLPPDVKIMGGKTLEELVASWVNQLEASAINSRDIAGDPQAEKFIQAFGDESFPEEVANFMREKAMAIASGQREPEASNPVKVAARGVTRDKLSEEEGK